MKFHTETKIATIYAIQTGPVTENLKVERQ